MAERLLLVEDREALRDMLQTALRPQFDVDAVADGAEALRRLADTAYAVVITDVRLPGATGPEVLAAARARSPAPEVVLMTAFAAVPDAVAALKAGAYDYLAKPFEPDELVRVALRAAERHQLLRRTRELEAHLVENESDLVGVSASILEVKRLIERLGPLPVPILLTGESGTGKEVVARELHKKRGHGPFVAVNCGAIPEALLESEMFGVAKGAFTGAGAARAGLIESAAGGTLFLDEIGELPPSLQVKLNRVLEEGEFRRVGDTETRQANVRLIAATHRDLDAAVQQGQFRADLFFRLKVVQLRLAPLRERREDVALLAARFLHIATARYGTGARRLSPETLAALEAAPWPGNVRELRHAVEHAAVLADGDTIDVAHLPSELSAGAPAAVLGTYRAATERAAELAGRDYLTKLLTHVQGNVTKAAAEAGVERESLHRLLRKHGVDPARFRKA